MPPILEVKGLTVRYGGVVAVSDVSFAVEPGTLTGLIGPNGAGKTTLIDALTGFTASSGEVWFRGRPVHGLTPHRLVAEGMVRTFQSIELFDDLSVEENVRVTSDRRDRGAAIRLRRRSRDGAADPARQALARLGLAELAPMLPTDLSHGQQKLVALARAIAAGPSLLLLDEPAAGFSVEETQELGRRLRELAGSGVTILLIDHDMSLVLGYSDDVYVVEFGRLIAHGRPEEIRRDPRVIAAYLGEDVDGAEALDAERTP